MAGWDSHVSPVMTSGWNDWNDPRVMTSSDRVDMEVVDEYDIDHMESWEKYVKDHPEAEFTDPQFHWTHPEFNNITAYLQNEPEDEYLGNYRSRCPELAVGDAFPNKQLAKFAVQKYSIKNRVEYKAEHSDQKRMVLVCRRDPTTCFWRIRIAKLKNKSYWEVRDHYEPHVCQNNIISRTNKHLSKKFLAYQYWDQMTEKLRFSAADIQARVSHDFGYDITYLRAWQAQQLMMELMFGTWEKSFEKLPQLMRVMKEHNPNTQVVWDRFLREDGNMQVNRVFWSFGETIEAFRYMRPVLCIDGTHMYGKYKATLLVALGLDANNHILPIAFAIVESENTLSWSWFMDCIRDKVTDREGICVISDRHAGILAAMRSTDWAEPKAYHRVCIRHLKSNFNVKVKDLTLKNKLHDVAHRKKTFKCDHELGELLALLHDKERAREWLAGIPKWKWALSYDDGGMRWGSMTTNASECFNHVLKFGRDLPISAFVMFTYKQMAEYFVERYGRYDKYGSIFPPKIEEKLETIRAKAQYHRVRMYDPERKIYEVTTARHHNRFTVCLETRTCECGKWTLFHYPCSHAMAVCKYEHIEYSEVTAWEYTIDAYNRTWRHFFTPLPDERTWAPYEGPTHVPCPLYKRDVVGRNPSTRHHNEMDHLMGLSQGSSRGEASTSQQPPMQGPSESRSDQPSTQSSQTTRIQKCSNCKTIGHNKRACPTRWG